MLPIFSIRQWAKDVSRKQYDKPARRSSVKSCDLVISKRTTKGRVQNTNDFSPSTSSIACAKWKRIPTQRALDWVPYYCATENRRMNARVAKFPQMKQAF